MHNRDKVNELIKDIDGALDAPHETVASAAELLVEKGWRKETRGIWVKDESYVGKNKEHYVCSCCGNWQSVKKSLNKIYYMYFCPYCGSRMDAPHGNGSQGSEVE